MHAEVLKVQARAASCERMCGVSHVCCVCLPVFVPGPCPDAALVPVAGMDVDAAVPVPVPVAVPVGVCVAVCVGS